MLFTCTYLKEYLPPGQGVRTICVCASASVKCSCLEIAGYTNNWGVSYGVCLCLCRLEGAALIVFTTRASSLSIKCGGLDTEASPGEGWGWGWGLDTEASLGEGWGWGLDTEASLGEGWG